MTQTGARRRGAAGVGGWCETEGTVTTSERRVQRVRNALYPPAEARDDICDRARLARRLGHDLASRRPKRSGTSSAACPRWHARHELRAPRKTRRPSVALSDDDAPGQPVPARRGCGSSRCAARGAVHAGRAFDPPVERSTTNFPMRLTTGRRLDSYNTGVQSGGYRSPLRCGETSICRPRTRRARRRRRRARAHRSRRGAVVAPVRFDRGLRPGLAFMTLHFQDEVDDQPAHHRRDGSEVGHRRVQGRGHSHRERL